MILSHRLLLAAALSVLAAGAAALALGAVGRGALGTGGSASHPLTVILGLGAAVIAGLVGTVVATRALQTQNRELDGSRSAFRQALTRLGDVLAATHDFDGIVDAVVETSLLVVPADAAVYYRFDHAAGLLVATHARGTGPRAVLPVGAGLAGASAAAGTVAVLGFGRRADGSTLALNPATLDPAEPRAVTGVAAPLSDGVLAVYGTSVGRAFSDDEVGLLVSLLRQAEVAIANIELHEQARRDALTDGLTGLSNRRQFDERLADAVAASLRFGEPFSVAIFDLDDFKRINDTWDHLAGDAVLVQFAGILRRSIREVDVACRWGGEEFAVLLQRTGPEEMAVLPGRILDLVHSTFVVRGTDQITFTVSAGVASFPRDGADGRQVVAAADSALMRAKTSGKDRVERASAPTDTTLVVDVTERAPRATPVVRTSPITPA